MVYDKDCMICASKIYLEFLRLGGGTSIPFECEHVENTTFFQIRTRLQQIITISLSVLLCIMPLHDFSSYIIRGGDSTNEIIKHIIDFLFKIKTSIILLMIIFSKNKLRIRGIRAMQELHEYGLGKEFKNEFGINYEFGVNNEFEVNNRFGNHSKFEIKSKLGIKDKSGITTQSRVKTQSRINRKHTTVYQIPVSSNVNLFNLRGTKFVLSRQNLIDLRKKIRQYIILNMFLFTVFAVNILYAQKPTSLYKIFTIFLQIYCFYIDLGNIALCWFQYKMYLLFLDKFAKELKYALIERLAESNKMSRNSIIQIARFYMGVLKNFYLTQLMSQDIVVTWALLAVTFTVLNFYLIFEGIQRNGRNTFSYYNLVSNSNTYWTIIVSPCMGIWFEQLKNQVSHALIIVLLLFTFESPVLAQVV